MTTFKIGDQVRSLRPHDNRTGEVFDIEYRYTPTLFDLAAKYQSRIRVKWNLNTRSLRTWFDPKYLALINSPKNETL